MKKDIIKIEPIKLDFESVKKRCKLGCGSMTCAYLVPAFEGFSCAKHSWLADSIRNKLTMRAGRARAVNCSGSPDWKPKSQDYTLLMPADEAKGLPLRKAIITITSKTEYLNDTELLGDMLKAATGAESIHMGKDDHE
jgi:hypothetical protein